MARARPRERNNIKAKSSDQIAQNVFLLLNHTPSVTSLQPVCPLLKVTRGRKVVKRPIAFPPLNNAMLYSRKSN